MRLSQELTVRPAQRLAMTPQLRQAIEALQLNTLELSTYIQARIEENPLLELAEDGEPADPGPEEAYTPGDDDRPGIPEPAAPAPCLAEQLAQALRLETADPAVGRAGTYLAASLDEDGYLRVTIGEAASALGLTGGQVREALGLLQSLEPGIAGRDLRECLSLQIGDGDPLLQTLAGHLDSLAAGRFGAVAEELGVDVATVRDALERLRRLEPRPGRAWAGAGGNQAVMPDLRFERVGDDIVVLVEEPVARVRLNPLYRRWLEEGRAGADRELQRYLERRLHAALWVLRCLEQRRTTLYRLGEAILECQRDFFHRGARHLLPLTMRAVAERVGVHESTVSRAAANKYAATPHGTFPLRFFFASGVECRGGEALSAASVKRLIQDQVAGEDLRQPLSDRDLAAELRRRGVLISRRTVSKYRQELGMAPSAARRRFRGAT